LFPCRSFMVALLDAFNGFLRRFEGIIDRDCPN
jgi:hypothetical protein